ncbi:MAG: hypothetical protein WCG27_07560 [Pseudomonadota bacterium]
MRPRLIELLTEEFHRQSFYFLTADIGFGFLNPLAELMGQRFINVGISETNLLGVAAGLSSPQEKVYTLGLGPFIALRGYEQIKVDLATHQCNVCMIAAGVGFYYGIQGPTHYTLEDISLLSNISGLAIYNPGTLGELEWSFNQISASSTPSYLRLPRLKGTWHFDKLSSSIGPSYYCCQEGTALTVITSGTMLDEVLKALPDNCQVISCPRPAPLNLSKLTDHLTSSKVVVVEEAVYPGPLASQVSLELWRCQGLANRKYQFHSLALKERALDAPYGDENFMRQQHGLDASSLKTYLSHLLKETT